MAAIADNWRGKSRDTDIDRCEDRVEARRLLALNCNQSKSLTLLVMPNRFASRVSPCGGGRET